MDKSKVTVVIPNYNGMNYIEKCLDSIFSGSMVPSVIVVDNASEDGSYELIRDRYADRVTLLRLKANTGFCHAVNSGIHITRTKYVVLLNNDTTVDKDCIKNLYTAIVQSKRCFSVQARMLSMKDPDVLDDAGDFYCALGWGFARGKAQAADTYMKSEEIFAACAGAAIYRMKAFEKIGYFDERHFCYLEDIDIGYRAKIYGLHNRYEPSAVVYHAGSASSGSVYNEFKELMTSGNNWYLLWKNMPTVQYILNYPLILCGVKIKREYFRKKGLLEAYENGLTRGRYLIERARYEDEMHRLDSPEKGTIEEEAGIEFKDENVSPGTDGSDESRESRPSLIHPLYLGGKVPFSVLNLPNYIRIQFELWGNIAKRLKY